MTLVFNLTASWLEQKERTQPQRGFFNPGNISYFSSKYRFVDLPHSYDLFFPTEKQTQAVKTFLIPAQQITEDSPHYTLPD